MKAIVTVLAAVFLSNVALANDPYFEIKNIKVKEVQEDASADIRNIAAASSCVSSRPMQNPGDTVSPISGVEVIVDQIINIGKKIFAVVAQGTPVVNFKTDLATALPQGIQCWSDLTNWNLPSAKTYLVEYENGFGATVVSFKYRVLATTGGSFNGVGQYITNATIQPASIDVSWGFHFNANAAIPTVFNRGSKESPLAGMQMNLQWSVDTPIAHSEQTEAFFVGGENTLIKMN